jgi:hypothetical protein
MNELDPALTLGAAEMAFAFMGLYCNCFFPRYAVAQRKRG